MRISDWSSDVCSSDLVCDDCGWIHYTNPKIVVGAVVSHDGRILLCRRAIEPRRGFWTIPAGYLDERETAEAGAMREAPEEACADITLAGLLAGSSSEERRGGKECDSPCRSGWSADQ